MVPGSRYADQVDSTTQALDHLRRNDDDNIWARLAAKTRRESLGSNAPKPIGKVWA